MGGGHEGISTNARGAALVLDANLRGALAAGKDTEFVLNGVGGITVHYTTHLWSPFWRLRACLDSGITYDILFNMQNSSKILLELKCGFPKVSLILL